MDKSDEQETIFKSENWIINPVILEQITWYDLIKFAN